MTQPDPLPDSDIITTEELVATFQTLANQTRFEALWAIWAAESDVVPFSQIKDGVSTRDNGNINYHLDCLEGEFITHTQERGYSLRPKAYFVITIAISNYLEESYSRSPTSFGADCPMCSDPLLFQYHGNGQAEIKCSGCTRTFVIRPVPPSAIRGRTVAEIVSALDARVKSDVKLSLADTCPYCHSRVKKTVLPSGNSSKIELYDCLESDNPYIKFKCRHCTTVTVVPATILLFEVPSAGQFFVANDRPFVERPFWEAFAWLSDGDAFVEDSGRLCITISHGDERISVIFSDDLTVDSVTRTRT